MLIVQAARGEGARYAAHAQLQDAVVRGPGQPPGQGGEVQGQVTHLEPEDQGTGIHFYT